MGGPDLSMNNCVIIDNIPKDIPREKYDKLRKVLYNNVLMNKDMGCHVKHFELCQNEEGKTTGFAFVEFENPAEAERCIAKVDGQKLDKQHVFRVCNFTSWERFKATPDSVDEVIASASPSKRSSEEGEEEEEEVDDNEEVENLESHLLDEKCREQYLVRVAGDTDIVWNDPVSVDKKEKCKSFKDLTELMVRWSPLGTYLTSTHTQGIQLWGGPSWKMLGRFAHKDVQLIDFSPKERYLVTWFNNLTIWEVESAKKIRAMPGGPTPEHGWPVFKWSPDERFMARIMQDNIHVFDTHNDFKLITPDPKKSTTLYIPHVRNFEWSPADNIIAYWVPEDGEKPAKVALVKLLSSKNTTQFQILTQKNLFRVKDVFMSWHNTGDFLAVKVDRESKTSSVKKRVTNFELFRTRSKGQIAVDVLDVGGEVIAFAWEPKGVRFAIICSGNTTSANDISFFTMGGQVEGTVKKVGTLENRQANHLFWSPKGVHCLLAGLRSMNGKFEFVNVSDQSTMGTAEHFCCTDVAWDPSGRFVTTSVSSWRYQMETGYNIWTFQGKNLLAVSRDKFYQFQWRPRPASLLSDAQISTIKKNLKERASNYEKNLQKIKAMQDDQAKREKDHKLSEFHRFIKERKEDMKQQTEARRAARRNCNYHSDDEDVWVVVEEMREEVIELEEEEM